MSKPAEKAIDHRQLPCRSSPYTATGNVEFQQGDLRQASEKAWGAVAQITKAYAESLASPLYHRSLKNIARYLVQTTGNRDFLMIFNAVERLHINFYEKTLSTAAVQAGI